ncbi:MAG: autotransporter-associated beta strand repeat-containing protein [Chthoniobacterales bacterium]
MKVKFLLILFSLVASATLHAGSATWEINPTNGSWHTVANWTPATIPNGPGDTASFGVSNTTGISLTAATEVDALIFDPGASAFTFTTSPASRDPKIALTLSGTGIVNNSGAIQNFDTGSGGAFAFRGSATAGNGNFAVKSSASGGSFGGYVLFDDSTSAADGVFVISPATGKSRGAGHIDFLGYSTAANGVFTLEGVSQIDFDGPQLDFYEGSTAGNSVITVTGGLGPGIFSGRIFFNGNSSGFDPASAGSATCINNGGQGLDAQGGYTAFFVNATAGQARLIANSGVEGGKGGFIAFYTVSDGAEAEIEVYGNGYLDVSFRDLPGITIGSLSGDGFVYLGAHNLTVGSNNLDTTFVGILEEGGGTASGSNGSLTKMGAGVFNLGGSSTYQGGTTVTGGVLRVTNVTGSATGTGPVQVNGGILGGAGIITGAVTIGTGSGAGAQLEPGVGSKRPTTITLLNGGTWKADGSYVYRLNTKRAKGDQVAAAGVTIIGGALFNFTAVANRKLNAGTTFTAINNTAATPIAGTFSNLANGSIFTVGRNAYQASYAGGDGNDLTLTVQP